MDKISDYEKLNRLPYHIPSNEDASLELKKFSDEKTETNNSNAPTCHSTNPSFNSHTYSTSDWRLYLDEKKDKPFRQFFTSKPSDKMSEIAENFVPEFANILLALIGAKFIQSIGSLK